MQKDQTNPWKTLSSEVVYKNKWYSIRQDKVIRPDGQPGEFNVMYSCDGVFIIAMDDDQNIHMIQHFRYPTNMMSIEIPAGGIDKGEDALTAAKRELMEEAGVTAAHWKQLGKFQAENAYTSNFGILFVATGLSGGDAHQELAEGITKTEKIPLKQAFNMIKTGHITDCQTVASLMMLALDLGLLPV